MWAISVGKRGIRAAFCICVSAKKFWVTTAHAVAMTEKHLLRTSAPCSHLFHQLLCVRLFTKSLLNVLLFNLKSSYFIKNSSTCGFEEYKSCFSLDFQSLLILFMGICLYGANSWYWEADFGCETCHSMKIKQQKMVNGN